MADSLSLLARLEAGDADALEELLSRNLPGLHGFVRLRSGKLLRGKEESADIVQSVCREVLANLDRFQYPSEAGFRQWLYLTALRKIKKRYQYYLAVKRDAGREVAPGSDHSAEELFGCYASFCTPSRELSAREEIARIEAAFERLSDIQREVILLARVVGLSHAEIAEQVGRTEPATRTVLSRGLARLTELLDDA